MADPAETTSTPIEADPPDEAEAEEVYCHDLAEALAEVRLPWRRKVIRRAGVAVALGVSILAHGSVLTLGLRMVTGQKRGEKPVQSTIVIRGDTDGILHGQTSGVGPEPVMQLPGVRIETVEPLARDLTPPREAEAVQEVGVPQEANFPAAGVAEWVPLGLATGAEAALSPQVAPIGLAGVKDGPVESSPSAPAQPEVRAKVIPGGTRGRRGVRNGLDDRGLQIPVYPIEAVRRRQQGVVRLELEVLADGSVGKVTVLSDPGYPMLVKAAIDVARSERFEPAISNGRRMADTVIIPYNFVLD